MSYYILRKYFRSGPWAALDSRGELVKCGLTLEAAQEHCQDPETSSSTCTTEEGLKRTEERGPWFDCYYEGSPRVYGDDLNYVALPSSRIPKLMNPWRC